MIELLKMYRFIYSVNPKSIFSFAFETIVDVLYEVCQILILPILIALIESGEFDSKALFVLISILFVYSLLSMLKVWLARVNDTYHNQNRKFFIKQANHYALHAQYAILDDEKKLQELYQAKRAVSTPNTGFEGASRQTIVFMVALLTFVIYCCISNSLDLTIFLCVLLASVLNFCLRKRMTQLQYEQYEEGMPTLRRFQYAFNASKNITVAKDMRVFSLGKLLLKYCESWKKEYEGLQKRYFKQLASLEVLGDVLYFLINIYVYCQLGRAVFLNHLSISAFTLSIGLVTGIENQLILILENYGRLSVCTKQMSYFYEKISLNDPWKDGEKVDDVHAPFEIVFKDVCFGYGDELLFDHFNLTIHPGEKLALLGTNGSGKSTLIKLLCRFYEPQSGSIEINNMNIKRFSLEDYPKLISAVFQDEVPLAFSILENLTSQKEPNENKMCWALEKTGLNDDLNRMKVDLHASLTTVLDENGIMLSGGQMQKLMMTRAIYKDAGILILDEPTAALDVKAEERLYQQYAALCENKTSIFISHRLSTTQYCDRIILMEKGRIIEEGTHASLMAEKRKYYEMFQVQSQYYEEGVIVDEA